VTKKYRKFTPDFREETARLVVESSRAIEDVARELNVNETSLGNWVRAYRENHAQDEPPLQVSERPVPTASQRTSGAGRRRGSPRSPRGSASHGHEPPRPATRSPPMCRKQDRPSNGQSRHSRSRSLARRRTASAARAHCAPAERRHEHRATWCGGQSRTVWPCACQTPIPALGRRVRHSSSSASQ
jgi:transposase